MQMIAEKDAHHVEIMQQLASQRDEEHHAGPLRESHREARDCGPSKWAKLGEGARRCAKVRESHRNRTSEKARGDHRTSEDHPCFVRTPSVETGGAILLRSLEPAGRADASVFAAAH